MNDYKTSVKGKAIIRHYEGCKLNAYRCSSSVWTIGIGHTKGVKPGDRITAHVANEYLNQDLAYFELELNNLLNRNNIQVNQGQFDALISFVFNLKNGIIKLEKSELFFHIRKQSDHMVRIADVKKGMKFLQYFVPNQYNCFPEGTKEVHIITYMLLNWISGRDPKTKQLIPLPGLYKRRVSESILYLENILKLF